MDADRDRLDQVLAALARRCPGESGPHLEPDVLLARHTGEMAGEVRGTQLPGSYTLRPLAGWKGVGPLDRSFPWAFVGR